MEEKKNREVKEEYKNVREKLKNKNKEKKRIRQKKWIRDDSIFQPWPYFSFLKPTLSNHHCQRC